MQDSREKIIAIIENARLGKAQAKAYFTVRRYGLSEAAKKLGWAEAAVKRLYFEAVDKVGSVGVRGDEGRRKLSNKKPNMDGEY